MDIVRSESKMVLNSTVKVILCKFFIGMLKSRWCLLCWRGGAVLKTLGVCHVFATNRRVWDKTIQWNLDVGTRDVNNFIWGKYLLCTRTFFLLGHQLFRVVLECWAAKPATELLYTGGVMRTPEMERILNPAKLEEYHRRGLNWKEHSKDMMFYFILFSPQFRGTSYTMISSEIALQEEWELFKWKTCAQLLFSWLIVYSYAQKPSYCNISMILVFLVFFLWQSVHQCTKLVF